MITITREELVNRKKRLEDELENVVHECLDRFNVETGWQISKVNITICDNPIDQPIIKTELDLYEF